MGVCIFTKAYLMNVFSPTPWIALNRISESVVMELDPFENSLTLNT